MQFISKALKLMVSACDINTKLLNLTPLQPYERVTQLIFFR